MRTEEFYTGYRHPVVDWLRIARCRLCFGWHEFDIEVKERWAPCDHRVQAWLAKNDLVFPTDLPIKQDLKEIAALRLRTRRKVLARFVCRWCSYVDTRELTGRPRRFCRPSCSIEYCRARKVPHLTDLARSVDQQANLIEASWHCDLLEDKLALWDDLLALGDLVAELRAGFKLTRRKTKQQLDVS